MSRQDFTWALVPEHELNIPVTLASGQAFRWRRTECGDWVGVIGTHAVQLRPEPDRFGWRTLPEPDRWDVIEDYFALDVPLPSLCRTWARVEPRMAAVIERWKGLRILRQPAEETFLCFLCATCNTVTKIRRSVEALAATYGKPLATLDGRELREFPGAADVASAEESVLRANLWGYRAPVVIDLARRLAALPSGWLERLRAVPYREAHAALRDLPGIGAKLADCICLFGLRHDSAVPVDTHVRQVAVRWYRPDLAERSLTPRVYEQVGSLFRSVFGPTAGWAQQYLFWDEIAYRQETLVA